MKTPGFIPISFVLAAAMLFVRCGSSGDANGQSATKASQPATPEPPQYAPRVLQQPPLVDKATERRTFDDAARTAWDYINHNYNASTGFVNANATWRYPTVWDIASAIASYYSARSLGLLSNDEYKQRTRQALTTLQKARLYHNIAYGRNYSARTGDLVGPDNQPSPNGTGYSALDVGRLLIWLKIVSNSDPDLAPLARNVAGRINARAIIRDGYLHAEQITDKGLQKYQEGRIGYEQYAATGFNLWGMRADRALNLRSNARRVTVEGVPVWTDTRGLDRLTSEPLIMNGLELGLNGDIRDLAWQTLSLQAKRYEQTGQVTIASEDALNDPPYYFYYYCVYCNGKEFVINVHDPSVQLNAPRWISAKAAFAWHALMPSKYTWLAVQAVQPARQPGTGWATGVYEKTNRSTGVTNLNTAAIILESALYFKTGRALLH